MAELNKPANQNLIVKPLETKEPPPEVLKINFKMDNTLFENNSPPPVVEDGKVVQSPEEKKATESARAKEEENVLPKISTDDNAKLDATKGADAKKSHKTSASEPEEEKEEKVEEKQSSLPKYLKPPKSKEAVQPVDKTTGKIHRDYAGYAPEEVEIFKQMSDKAYEFVTKKLKENKELASKSGSKSEEVVFQHPDGYLLSPDYINLSKQISVVQSELSHYEKALLDIKSGKPFTVITGYDRQGSPIYSNEIEASDDAEEKIRVAVTNGYRQVQDNQKQLQQIPTQFKSRIDTDLQKINQERINRFQWAKDPSLLDYTMNVEGIGEMSIKDVKQAFKELWPTYYRDNPGVEVASDLMIVLRMMEAELSELRSKIGIKQTIKEEQSLLEPSSKVQPAPAKGAETMKGRKNVPKVFSMEGVNL